MTGKRNSLLDGLFFDFASEKQKEKVNQLYDSRRKGSAVAYQLRLLQKAWLEIAETYKVDFSRLNINSN